MLKRIIRLTQPEMEPVSLEEAKRQLRIPAAQTVEDAVISGYISAAREQAEQFIDCAICESDFVLVFDYIASDSFCLNYPASAVASVTYRDEENEEQTAIFTYDEQLNTVFFDEIVIGRGVKFEVTAGSSSYYPESLRQAILMLIGDLYTGRSSIELVNKAAIMMLMPFKNRPIV